MLWLGNSTQICSRYLVLSDSKEVEPDEVGSSLHDLHERQRTPQLFSNGWRAWRFKRRGAASSISSSWPGARTAAPTHKATHRGISLNAKDAFPVGRKCARSDGNEGVRAIAFPHKRQQWVDWEGDAWPVSPWPVPRAEGQEVARDPGRIQALLCLSVSNHYQILHSNGQRSTSLSDSEGYVTSASLSFSRLWLRLQGTHLLLSCGYWFVRYQNTAWGYKVELVWKWNTNL